jgi:excisionase family DNA binding protein
MTTEKPDLLDYASAAAFLGLSEFTLRRYVSKGIIGCVKLGPKLVRFAPESLSAWLMSRMVEPRRASL